MLTESEKSSLIEFNEELNQEPVHSEKSEDGDYHHIPIAYLEADLSDVFLGLVQYTNLKVTEMFGSITTTMTLEVYHPIMDIWLKYDGTAAVQVENISPGDFKGTTKLMYLEEMKIAVALCYSEAIKNAAKKIPGKRFGSDLNRINKPGSISALNVAEFDASSIKTEVELQAAILSGQVTKPMIPTIRKMMAGVDSDNLLTDPVSEAESFIEKSTETKKKKSTKKSA